MATKQAELGENHDNIENDITASDTGSKSSIKLKREIGLYSAVNLILGVMIGSGIFVSPSSAFKYAGSVGLCLVIWILSGIISLLGALSFAELGTVVTKSGAEYSYFEEAFGKMHRFWGPLPSFICAWVYVMVLRPIEVAVIVKTCGQYAVQPFTSYMNDKDQDWVFNLTSISALFIMTYINMTSVKLYVKVQNIFGVFKVFACLIVIGGGIYEIAKGNTVLLSKGFEDSNWNAGALAFSLCSGLWAYDGWNSVTVVTEEIINPAVNVPLSISIAVPLITALYVFMNVAYMTVLSYTEMTTVTAVAVEFGARVLGPAQFLIPLGVAVATFGCAMSVQFGVTRVCYTAAKGGHMLELFSYVNMKRLTPAPAVAFQCLLTSIFILTADINTLIIFASWFLWFFYGIAMVALLVLRRTQPDKHRPYRVPTVIPWFVLLVAIFLSVAAIVHEPSAKYFIAFAVLLTGVLVYTVFVYFKKTPTALLNKLTFYTQVLFESIPPSNHED